MVYFNIMTFLQSVRICFLKFANFKGRASRSEFWWFQFFCLGGGVILGFVDEILFKAGYELYPEHLPLAMSSEFNVKALLMSIWGKYHFSNIFFYATLIPSISVTIRRFHDIGLSGWRSIGLVLIPFAILATSSLTGAIFTIHIAGILGVIAIYAYWLTKASDPFENKFGLRP